MYEATIGIYADFKYQYTRTKLNVPSLCPDEINGPSTNKNKGGKDQQGNKTRFHSNYLLVARMTFVYMDRKSPESASRNTP